MILLLLSLANNNVCAVTDSPNFRAEFIQLEDTQASNIEFFINKKDLNQDLRASDALVKVVFDGSSLLREKTYPQNIKLEVSTMINGKKSLLSLLNKTIKSKKSAENIYLPISLPRIEQTTELIFDLYDSHNILNSTFIEELVVNSNTSTESNLESMPGFDCEDTDGECLVEYLLRHVTFSANYDTNLKTEIYKNDKGRFFVNIPIKKGQKLGSKVKGLNINGSGAGKGSTSAGNFSGIYPYYVEKNEVASSFWNELRNAIEFKFNGSNKSFHFRQDGSLQLSTSKSDGYINIASGTSTKAPIVFSQGELLTNLVDGALEYDGTNLYFTNGNTRNIIGARGPAGADGPAGPTGAQGPAGPPGSGSGIDLSNGGFLNGNISFVGSSFIQDAVFNGNFQYKTGAQNGYVLTSDTNGNASWQAVSSGSGGSASGSAGAIQFSDGSNGFNSDASNLFWDNTNKRLDIGSSGSLYTYGPAQNVNLAYNTYYDVSTNQWRRRTANPSSTILELQMPGSQEFAFYTAIDGTATANSLISWKAIMGGHSSGTWIGGNTNTNSELSVINTSASKKVLNLRGAVAQTANLTEWQNFNGATLTHVDREGYIRILGTTPAQGYSIGNVTLTANTGWGNPGLTSASELHLAASGRALLIPRITGPIIADYYFTSPSEANIVFGSGNATTSATPTGATLQSQSGSGTDISAASLKFAGGRPTGNGSGGDLIFFTANGGTSGSSIRDLHERMRITQTGTTIINGSLQFLDGTQAAGYVLTSDANGLASWQAPGGGGSGSASGTAGAIQFSDGSNGFNSDASNLFWNNTNGWLGVSTSNPRYDLQVNGNTMVDKLLISGAGETYSHGIYSDSSLHNKWESGYGIRFEPAHSNTATNPHTFDFNYYADRGIYESGESSMMRLRYRLNANNPNGYGLLIDQTYGYAHGNGNLIGARFAGNMLFKVQTKGQVGINTANPQAKLHVNGNFMLTDGTQAGGYVLTSDANGLASWQAPSISSSEWTDNGTTMYPNEATDNVAIGGTTSAAPIFMDASTGTINATAEFNAGTATTFTEYSVQRIWSGNSSYHISSNLNDILNMKRWNANYGDYIPGFDAEDKFVFALDWNNNSANGGEFVLTRNVNTIGFNGDSSVTLFTVKETGNVGIGTYTPQATLDLIGNIKITDGTQATGRVLTSDANGLASWQAAGAGDITSVGNCLTGACNDFTLTATAATVTPFSIRGASGQTAKLSSILDANGAELMTMDKNGYMHFGDTSTNSFIDLYKRDSITGAIEISRPNVNSTGLVIYGNNTGAGVIFGASETGIGFRETFGTYLAGVSRLSGLYQPASITNTVFKADINTIRNRDGSTLSVEGGDAFSTDNNGGNLYLAGGLPTGSGLGGDIIFQTANGGSTGTTLRDLHERMRITQAGLISINGSVLIKDGTQAAGYVLTSDANGLASWQAPGGGGSEWTDTGSIMHPNEITDDLAIGGTNSSAPIFANGTTGYLDAVRLRINSDATNRYIDGSGFYTNLTNTIRGSDVRLTPTTTGNTFVIIDDETVGGVANSLAIKPAIGKNLTLRGYNSDGIADRLPGAIYLQGGNAHDNNVVNIHGGGLYFEGGAGASDDNSNGGNLYFDGGLGYNSGTHGNIIFSNTRGNVGIGTSTPQRKLHISEAMRLEPQTSPPASASMGDLYVDDSGALCFYDGTSWSVAAGAGSCS